MKTDNSDSLERYAYLERVSLVVDGGNYMFWNVALIWGLVWELSGYGVLCFYFGRGAFFCFWGIVLLEYFLYLCSSFCGRFFL